MTEDSTPALSEEQKKLVQEGVAKVRSEHRSLNAPSPEDLKLIYAAVAKDLAKLDPTSNPDPATIPNPTLRKIFEETRNDMVKHAAGRHALDSDIAALREEAKGAAGLEVKQVPVGTMGLKENVITGDLLKPDQAPAVVKDGEFKLPEAVAQQALDAVKKLGKKGEVQGMEEAAFLDGNANDLTDKEKAAMLLAKSAKIDVSPEGKVTTTIDGKLTPEKFLETDGKNPDAVFEAAKLILAKTYGVEGGAETKGPDGQQAFVQAAKTPPATERTR